MQEPSNRWGKGVLVVRARCIPTVFMVTLIVFSSAKATEPQWLWSHPATNVYGGELLGAYKTGDLGEGWGPGVRALFFFDYFFFELHGDLAFMGEGSLFSLSLDFNGRYGPLYLGPGLGLHWLPGAGSAPAPTLSLQAGLHVPSGLDGFWFDLGYRPQIIFRDGENLVYHGVYLGVIIEAGL